MGEAKRKQAAGPFLSEADRSRPRYFGVFGLPPYVGVHQPEAVDPESSREMKVLCRYCADDREAHKIGGVWFHVVARGGEHGQYETCAASKLRNAI